MALCGVVGRSSPASRSWREVYSASELYRGPLAIGMLVLVIVYLAALTWQTMGVFRCARRVGGFWLIVAIVVLELFG
jgi:hypothetical protein